jgi:small subunit ribosomal protein S16
MAVSIRLRREGTTNSPYYKIVVADSRSPRDGKFIEIIGNYDPKKAGPNSTLNLDRADYWIARGAQPSDTVRSLLKSNRAHAAAPAEETPLEAEAGPVETESVETASAEAEPVEAAPVKSESSENTPEAEPASE